LPIQSLGNVSVPQQMLHTVDPLGYSGTTFGAISVKWFGAKGDGVANDSTAIRNALNAAAGKTVYVPSGAYNIASTLLPPANTRLVGDGYKGNSLLVATSDVVMIKLNNPRVTLESLDFDCTNQTVQPAIWLNSSELSICCCRLLNVALYGIYASGSASDVSIVSNRFTGRSPVLVPSYGVSFDYSQGAEAVLTQGNYFTYFEVGIRSYGITGSAHIHNIIEAGATGFWVLVDWSSIPVGSGGERPYHWIAMAGRQSGESNCVLRRLESFEHGRSEYRGRRIADSAAREYCGRVGY
jgi:hypothetical protein